MKIAKQWKRSITRADDAGISQSLQQAAGVMLLNEGKVLILRRTGEGAGKWDFPGGGMEAGETPEQAAIRECREETGIDLSGQLSKIGQSSKYGADYTTFLSSHPEQTEPILSAEHDSFAWSSIDDLKNYDMHPGIKDLLRLNNEVRSDSMETELDVAKAIRDGAMPSPQQYGNITLFDVRISGTGTAKRILKGENGEKTEEFVFRDPALYLNDEFLARCNGLPVIIEHPKENTLNTKEFSDRIIGTILLPYIKGSEVWGIAKIYDDAAAEMMAENKLSTSPAVVFRDASTNEKHELEDGKHLLIEGKPSLLDHLAVVEQGVWDKGGEPSGVKSSNVHVEKTETSRADSGEPSDSTLGENKMPELNPEAQAKKDEGEAGGMGEVLALLKSLSERMSKLELAEQAEAKPAAVDAAAAPAPAEPAPAPAAAPAANPDNAMPSAEIDAMSKRVDALEAQNKPMPEEESAKMADAQYKADSVYQAFGDAAPRPMLGESLLSYRKRLLGKMAVHSEKFKGVAIQSISDSSVLEVIEASVYADALAVANSPSRIPDGVLMEYTKSDATGRKITEFKGSMSAWTNQFKAPKRRMTGINKTFH